MGAKFYVKQRNVDIGEMPEESVCQHIHARLISTQGWLSALGTAQSMVKEAKSKGGAKIPFTDYLGNKDWISLQEIIEPY